MGLRRALSVLLIFLLLPIYAPQVHAERSWSAEISPIILGLGDSVRIANYTIQFYDVSTNWSLVTIRVAHQNSVQLLFLREGEIGYFPTQDSAVFEIVVNSIDRENGLIVISVVSPLVKVRENLQMVPNETVVINKNVMVRLLASWANGATIGVKVPPLTEFSVFNLTIGQSRGFDYQLAPGVMYVNYLQVELQGVSKDVAWLNVYLPKLDAENLTMQTIPATNGSKPVETEPTVFVEVWEGYLHQGIPLSVETPLGTSTILVTDVTHNKTLFTVNFTFLNGSSVTKDLAVPVGEGVTDVGDIPIMLAVDGTEVDHGRALIEVLAPLGSAASKPPEPANVSVSISAVPTELMAGDMVAVSINVANNGPGEAKNLVIAAPVPNGFELVGNETGWSVGDLAPYSKVPAIVYVLRPTSPGEFTISGVVATYYAESGEKVQVKSTPDIPIRVYDVPDLHVTILGSNLTSSGSWNSYVHTENMSPVSVIINVTATGTDGRFEYITDAELHLSYPQGVVGPALIGLGNLSAGNNIEKTIQVRPLETGRFPIRASLVYRDPLGGEHELDLGTVLVIDTVPPEVIVKEKVIHVYPSEEELPDFVNETLKNSTNAGALAEDISNVIEPYLPKETNYWKLSTAILLVLVLILGYLAYGYYREVQTFRKFLLRKRKSRPGGLPRKWKRDELEVLLRELRLEVVRENMPPERKPPEGGR
ncbi:MAG: hypothetical protein J7K48_01780 [Thermococcus sp.]|uniref:DUF11 domain-containing protein n=1 Tax=Thermococcus guaymasensis DSM 11113 TaxID=1432656 RepID=A0A0X1KIL6_9EURY|nr:DUF11 domain-containing protein [Thermococcus guaymasensis]AJC71114.1 hypothetical protein X802_02170 [Thermococcus guaymasensis DSM 11113]MCD6523720.1 hypothetical protein [Thermococcus sp.]